MSRNYDENQKSTFKQKSESWILLYELFSSDLISEEEFARRLNLFKSLSMYRKFKDQQIHFIQ